MTISFAEFFYQLFANPILILTALLTLAVIIGIPMLILTLTLIPAVRQAAEVVSQADDRQVVLLSMQWMKIGLDFLRFVEQQWPIIQLVSAIVSLPLSYLCMRGTQQP